MRNNPSRCRWFAGAGWQPGECRAGWCGRPRRIPRRRQPAGLWTLYLYPKRVRVKELRGSVRRKKDGDGGGSGLHG